MLSRRTFLKIAGGAALAAPFAGIPRIALGATGGPSTDQISPPPRPFGRAVNWMSRIRSEPRLSAPIVGRLVTNDVVPLLGQIRSASSPSTYNRVWFRVPDGWVHSAWVQPAENQPQVPQETVDEPFWGEVYVPRTVARSAADAKAARQFDYYFGSVFQVLARETDAEGKPWYEVSDGITRKLFVPAEHLRRVLPEETTPISPDVPMSEKSIVVDTVKQIATAFEYGKPVFSATVATGAQFTKPDGTLDDFRTTKGTHRIYEKRFSSRMIGGGVESDPDYYDLPGVSWVSYFTASRIAFHAAYWHNDFGNPRSHGCVNMLPEHAKWVYRWTMPVASYDQRFTRVKSAEGSLVKVI